MFWGLLITAVVTLLLFCCCLGCFLLCCLVRRRHEKEERRRMEKKARHKEARLAAQAAFTRSDSEATSDSAAEFDAALREAETVGDDEVAGEYVQLPFPPLRKKKGTEKLYQLQPATTITSTTTDDEDMINLEIFELVEGDDL